MRNLILAIVPTLAVMTPVPGQDIALEADLAAGFADRTPLEDGEQPLAEALRHVSSLSPEELSAAAGQHAALRRETLSGVAGETIDDFSITHDLLRFPETSRGKPVELRGVVHDVKEVAIGGEQATVVRLVPSDAPSGRAAVLLPPDAETPAAGDRVRVVGLFLKLAELPDEDEGESVIAPLLVAPVIQREETAEGVLPDRSLWSAVEHRTLVVRANESGLYYRLLRRAAEADPAALREAAAAQVAERRRERPQFRDREPFPVFVDLFQNPQEYEGEAVTLTGYAREIRKYPAGENAEGLETLYEVWLYTDDSQSNPVVVVAADAPPGLPVGEDLQVPVHVTGYFFKIYGYEAQDTTRVAPMILAGRIEVLPEPKLDGPPRWLLGLLGVLFGALLIWLIVSYWGTRRRRSVVAGETPPDFAGIE